ncbi:50S ribosomal protein L4 [Methanococcus maripaludis]|uniref:Large ribosomal subunit protein uL4 n=1 Tax=Methanococcus maripaludis TaxID=39152 RepID=A0A8T4H4I5_METMI|nr:50S ribosomal protein L4 [Methanococcus maripaludis]MBM7409586.1 large subunit ribosomal protein L4e [Methanococcus maripaludis]MBP2219662.1 large subunit ribosomal protein L4e [Methanococcus maripaludis]
MNVKVYNLDGSEKGDIELPSVFEAEYRPDLIKRAVISSLTAKLQPKGCDAFAGYRTSAKSIGKGHGKARVRRTAQGAGAFVPQAVGGRRAHPPKVEKILFERINRKEKLKALASAIAASANPEIVSARGHKIEGVPSLPLVVNAEFESLVKTKEVLEVFKTLKLDADLERAKDGVKIRAGRGKLRGRKYIKPKSVLVVVGDACEAITASRNLAGVDVITANDLSAIHIAPGTMAGRLTLWTENAIEKINGRF